MTKVLCALIVIGTLLGFTIGQTYAPGRLYESSRQVDSVGPDIVRYEDYDNNATVYVVVTGAGCGIAVLKH